MDFKAPTRRRKEVEAVKIKYWRIIAGAGILLVMAGLAIAVRGAADPISTPIMLVGFAVALVGLVAFCVVAIAAVP